MRGKIEKAVGEDGSEGYGVRFALDKDEKNMYNKQEDLYISSPLFIKEVHKSDRESFSRQLANKTKNISANDPCGVTIYCGQKIYFFMQSVICKEKCLIRYLLAMTMLLKKLERGLNMELTPTQKALIYGLTLFPLTDQDQKAIFHLLKTDEKRMMLIIYLKRHENATSQEILNETARIMMNY